MAEEHRPADDRCQSEGVAAGAVWVGCEVVLSPSGVLLVVASTQPRRRTGGGEGEVGAGPDDGERIEFESAVAGQPLAEAALRRVDGGIVVDQINAPPFVAAMDDATADLVEAAGRALLVFLGPDRKIVAVVAAACTSTHGGSG